MLVGVDAAAQSPAPAPGYPQGYPPSYPAPAQPSYPAPAQPSYPAPAQPSYPAPAQPSYPAPAQPSYPAPAQPSYPAPAQPSYPAPAQPSYPAPAQPSYPAPAQPSYPAPAQPSYPAPAQPSYPAPAQPSYPAPAQPSYPAPAQPSYPAPAPGYPAQAPGYPPPAAAPAPGYPTQAPGYPAQGYGAPAAAAAAGAPWFQSGYVHVGGSLGFHGWGSAYGSHGGDFTLKGKFLGGVNLSAYYVSSPSVQIGGYFHFGNGKINDGDTDQYSLGLSLKAGSRVAERVWLGFAGDLGFYALDFSLAKAWYGVEISPRIHLDVLGLNAGGPKLGFFASFGPSVVPYAAGSVGGADVRLYLIYLTMQLGVTFGS